MEIAQTVLTWLSVPVGILSAFLWYRASTVIICEGDPKATGGICSAWGIPGQKRWLSRSILWGPCQRAHT